MPLLDVSEVLDDPDFQTQIIVAATTVTGSIRGREVTVDAPPVVRMAVVQPASSQDLQRLPDAALSSGTITIWAKFPFASDTPTTKADVVTWRGSAYTVMVVDDWGEFGEGYYRAVARRDSIP